MKLIRPYKETTPVSTISRIQKILLDLNINVKTVKWNNPFNNIYSVRLEALEENGNFGANGKGLTELYCLASAYAEYIERVQNEFIAGAVGLNKIFLDKVKAETGYYYFPDEQIVTKKELLSFPDKILRDLFPSLSKENILKNINFLFSILKNEKRKGLISVPFFDLSKGEIKFLPFNLLLEATGSNGMASGNTISEATFQAMCEIYERNAAYIIYHDELTPPTVPKEFLSKFEEENRIISEIENEGYEVIVKDFSCGINLPVVGLLIIDMKNKKYRLNIGSDTCFKIALNRTLTEIFQGSGLKDIPNRLLNFPSKNETPYFYGVSDDFNKEYNYKEFVKSGSGIFPPSLMKKKSSYSFDSSVFGQRKSYEEEVKYLFNLAKELKYDVYVRDVSFLGFPTVYAYIPDISIFGKKELNYINDSNNDKTIVFDEFEKYFFPFGEFLYDEEKILKVVEIIEKILLTKYKDSEIKLRDLFRLDFKQKSIWKNISIDFFLVLLYSLLNKYEKASFHLKKYLNKSGINNNSYFNTILEYFDLLIQGKSTAHISDDIKNIFKSPESLFSFIKYPNCPNCSSCKLYDDCLTKINFKNTLRIHEKSKEYLINQNKFSLFM